MEKKSSSPSVARSAGAMSLGTLISRILGLVRDQILASLFPKMVTDAFVVAFRLPNLFRRLLGEGALSVSFIPVYIEKRQSSEEDGLKIANVIFTIVSLVSAGLSFLGVLFMPFLLTFLVSGDSFVSIPGKLELAIFLARVMFSYLFLVSIYAFLMTLLQAHKKFLLPALAPAAFNLCVILIALFFSGYWSSQGMSLAIGVLVGGVVQTLIVFWGVYKLKMRLRFSFALKTKGIKRIFLNMLPGLIGMGVLQIMGLANLYFASLLPEGSHSYIYLADRVLEFPQSLIAISMGAALLPTLSQLFQSKQKQKFLQTLQTHSTLFLFLAIPSAIGLYFLSRPIVQVLFMRGEFTIEDVRQTAEIVKIYSLVLLFSGFNKVIVPAFYAIQNTWLPALTSSLSLVFHIAMASLFVKTLGLQGLIISMLISSIANTIFLLFSLSKWVDKLDYYLLLKEIIKFIPSLFGMTAVIYFLFPQLELYLKEYFSGNMPTIFALSLVILLSIVIYFIINKVFGVRYADQILTLLNKRRVR